MEQFTLMQLSVQDIKSLITEIIREELKKITPPTEPTKGMVLLSKKEVAKYLSISLTSLDKFIKQGLIKPIKMGSLIRFDKYELEESLKGEALKNRRSRGR